MKSIRVYMLVAVLATITLINFIAALQGYRSSMRETQALFDQHLTNTANLLSHFDLRSGEPAVSNDQLIVFQIIDSNGRLVHRSVQSPTVAMASLTEGYSETNFAGFRWRVFSHWDSDQTEWIQVAERVDLRYLIADNIIVTSIIPVMLALPFTGFLLWLIISKGLKSLNQLSDALHHKRIDDLSPISLAQTPQELSPVVAALNALLDRLNASFEREQRFAADAAHELRTPISALQIHTHNLTKQLPQCNETIGELAAITQRLGHIVEQILALYRTNPEHYPARFEHIDIHSLCQDVIAENYALIDEKRQSIELIGQKCLLQGDRFSLSLLVSNLLSNAVKYSPVDGTIQITTESETEHIVLTINDSGDGVSEEQYPRLAERFYRVGGDRHNQDIPGCGLGLSIVQHSAELHQATIVFSSSPLGGLSVSVRFPSKQHKKELLT